MSAPTDCRGADQFQPSHRDGYGDHLASALDRARKGWALNAAEASALVAEVERLRAMRKSVSELCNAKAQAAYNRYESECCGRGGTDCCGMPVQRWSDSDEEIMAFADSVLRALAGP